ncbi:MAG: polysaccharide biosynthesis protein [Lachnospiraceae bacterium]|nr:polysaccharide biosynthesis protein [Lachnospiraceae bacterium]
MGTNKKSGFIMQAGILAAAGILVRIIGILYRSPLVAIIGDEGNGYYSTAYTIYTIILLISTNGIPSAVSKIVAGLMAKKQYRNAHKILMGAFCYVVVAGGLASVFCFLFADKIVGSSSAAVLKVFTPTIFFSGLLGVFRGYFQAHGSMLQTSFSQIMEQIVNALVSIGAAIVLMGFVKNSDPSTQAVYGAMGSAMGTGAGVLTALLFMVCVYSVNRKMFRRRRSKDRTTEDLTYGQVFKMIFTMVTPVILSTCIYNMSSATNLEIYCEIVERLKGYTEAQATTYYGLYSGKANPITNIPIAFATAMSSAIIPTISGSFEKGDRTGTKKKVGDAIKTTMLISIPAAVGMCVLAKPVVFVLYPQQSTLDMVAGILRVLAISVVFYGLSTLTNGVLQGTGYVNKPVIHAAISLVIQTAILVLLLVFTNLDIYALAVAAVCYSLCMCLMNGLAIRKKLGYKQEFIRTFLLPAIAAIGMGGIALASYKGMEWTMIAAGILEKGSIQWGINCICLAVSIFLAVLAYFAMIIKFGAVTKEELKSMPKGATLVRIAGKLRLL